MTFCEKGAFLPAFGRVGWGKQGVAGRRLSPAVGVRGRRREIPAFAGMTFGWSQGDTPPPLNPPNLGFFRLFDKNVAKKGCITLPF